ncbi:MAG TPA: TonB-dependent receptor, partial [Tenuifilaceae bacterium]|nr:TonB-dependent receptor [Tenuifilaceae bacterium]
GFQQVRINGLEGPYSQIRIDSRPIFSSLAGVYGLEQIPVNMIERVEVTRGGGSAIFGSNAIAGVINIITKEPQGNSFSLSYNNTLTGSSPDNNLNLNASVVDDDLGSGLMVYGSVRNRDHFDNNSDGFSEIPLLENTTIGLRGYHKLGSKAKLVATYHHISEFRRGGNKFNLEPQFSDIAEQTAHEIDGGGLSLDYFPTQALKLSVFTSLQHIDRKSYYGAGMNPNAFGNTSNLSISGGTQIAYSMDKLLFSPAQLTGGFEYSHDDLHDVVVGYNRDIKQDANIAGLFLQNEWKGRYVNVLVGARADKHNLIDHIIFSPRVNLLIKPVEDFQIRTSYSSGYRAPQTFDEDLHITAVNGEVSLIQVNPNLKEERSHSVSLSGEYIHDHGDHQVNFLAEAFYTKLDDVFIVENIGTDAEGNLLLERRNGSGAEVFGVNLEGKYAPSSKFFVTAGVTLQRNKY